jgi:serine/threonine protein kinase
MGTSADNPLNGRSGSLPRMADALWRAWQQARTLADAPELGQFLPPPGDPQRLAALHLLIPIDLEIRWQRQQRVALEHYLQKYTDLGTTRTLPPNLVYEEYRIRHIYGDRPDVATYKARFPEQFPELLRRVQAQPATPPPTPQAPTFVTPIAPHGSATPGSAPPAAGGLVPVGGGYNLIRRIGSGGFGEVWQAEAPGGIPAAVKMIFRPLDHADAQSELKALELIKRLRHGGLLQTHAYWSLEDRLFIVMELADGSLRDRLKACKAAGLPGVPAAELLGYLHDTAEALDFLHKEHVQHRDVKPENILLLQGRAKLADFGLARLQESTRLATASGGGTPAYMAPEVWKGKTSSHSDQYSLATTYVELRLGHRPFTAENLADVMRDILEKKPDLAPLPGPEQQVLRKALAKEPADRYPNCKAFARALYEAVDDDGASGTVLPTGRPVRRRPPPPPPPPPRTKLWLMVSLAAGLLLVCGVLLKSFLGTSPAVVRMEHCEPVGEATQSDREGRRYYEHVRRVLPETNQASDFLLIPRRDKGDPPTFYMMRDKVSVGQFRTFAQRVGLAWKSDLADDYPAFQVTVSEAQKFAEWVGGQLPTEEQWDKAAGLRDPGDREGPYVGRWEQQPRPQIALDLEEPMKVGEAADDRSPFGCRDMAGNGQEWTRLPEDDSLSVPLRGVKYTDTAPPRYRDWKTRVWGGGKRDEHGRDRPIGFRVVLVP